MNLICDALDSVQIQTIIFRGQHVRANLDDDGFAGLKDFLSDEILHEGLGLE